MLVSEETCCRHMGYSFRLTAMVLLYAQSNRQDSTYHNLCYTSHRALAGTRNINFGVIDLKNMLFCTVFYQYSSEDKT